MYTISKKRIVSDKISIENILKVILSVEEYKNFIPWCTNVVMIEDKIDNEQYFIADLFLEFLNMKHTYRSKTEFTKVDDSISIITNGNETNIIKYLKSSWNITKINDNIIIDYNVDIDLKINIPFLPVEKMLNTATDKIIEAFEKRVISYIC